jgi:hypothetical protein
MTRKVEYFKAAKGSQVYLTWNGVKSVEKGEL